MKEHYDELYRTGKYRKTNPEIFEKARQYTQGNIVIDLGCGPGDGIKYFDANKYYGLDYSIAALEMAHGKIIEYKNRPHLFLRADLNDGFFIPDEFDIYVAIEFFEHIDIKKFMPKLIKGKEIFLSVPNYDSKGHKWYAKDLMNAIDIFNKYILIDEGGIFRLSEKNEIYWIYGRLV